METSIRSWADEASDDEKNNHEQCATINFYNCGFLIPRIKDTDNGLYDKTIEFTVYNFEREIFTSFIKSIEQTASHIGVLNVKPGHSAVYKFSMSITKGEFLDRIYSIDMCSQHEFFHGLFDSVSHVKMNRSIKFQMNEYSSRVFLNTIDNLFGSSYFNTEILPSFEITDRAEIIKWRDAVYYNHNNNANYKYNVVKETQINDLLNNKNANHSRINKRIAHQNNNNGNNGNTVRHYTARNTVLLDAQEKKETSVSHPASQNSILFVINDYDFHNCNEYTIIDKSAAYAAPNYATSGSVGSDISITRFIKSSANGLVQYYGTNLIVVPHPETYFQLFPRSSLSSEGFILANSVGVIDNDYRGELIIALINLETPGKQIETFPKRVAQLVTMPMILPSWKLRESARNPVSKENDKSRERGAGGFGST